MSFKAWISIVTLALIVVVVFLSRHELVQAFNILSNVNLWILSLLIPGQIVVYFVSGEMIFSYLRQKGALKAVPVKELVRMALEMNFVNHVMPSGGVSGMSYMTWRLGKYKVTPGRAAMAQLVRFAMAFAAYIALLLVAVVAVTIDGDINRWIIFVSFSLILATVLSVSSLVYLLSSRHRMWKFSAWVVRTGNRLVNKVTFGRKTSALRYGQVEKFFTDIHFDYRALRRDRRVLAKPFMWGIMFTLFDVALFMITFWSMGVVINPAPVLIAYGVAAVVAILFITPGGAGAYEAVMVGFLALAGVNKSEAIAGIVLARVILMVGTILFGYIFYQRSIIKYGQYKKPATDS